MRKRKEGKKERKTKKGHSHICTCMYVYMSYSCQTPFLPHEGLGTRLGVTKTEKKRKGLVKYTTMQVGMTLIGRE